VIPSVAPRARNGTRPVPPRRMQRSSTKLGQLCHSASSLKSLQRRTVASSPSDFLRGHGPGPSEIGKLTESLRGFIEEARVGDKRRAVRKGATGVLDRAANWAHATPMRKRRLPPQGIPQESVEKILRVPQDMFEDDAFNTELGGQVLPKGSFLEVRRSVCVKCNPLPCCS
jgi:hypothetical protein